MRQERRPATDRAPRDAGYRKNGQPHPDHHLWRNGRLWWIAFTIHRSDWTAERIRRSLGTSPVGALRVVAALLSAPAPLRYTAPRARIDS